VKEQHSECMIQDWRWDGPSVPWQCAKWCMLKRMCDPAVAASVPGDVKNCFSVRKVQYHINSQIYSWTNTLPFLA
jgi:hypothetical protein